MWCPTLSMLLSRRFDFVGMWRSGMWVACSAKSASEGRWASRGPGHPGAMLTAPAATYLRRTDHVQRIRISFSPIRTVYIIQLADLRPIRRR